MSEGDLSAGNLIDERWLAGEGEPLVSWDPANGEEVWSGREAGDAEVDAAVAAARSVVHRWRSRGMKGRGEVLEAFAEQLREGADALARLISQETGKPLWESRAEIQAMRAKVPISIAAYEERCAEAVGEAGGGTARTRFKPHGVTVVLGPFNFPGHIPNGHIVPALLAGNTVVFKPSEHAPGVAQWVAGAWQRAGLPPGVLNLVQGGRRVGERLAAHPGIDGLFFTGSHRAGIALHRLFGDHPEKILALEMGGNNPLVVWDPENIQTAANLAVLSAYLTAGQRCTCARRLVVPKNREGDGIVDALCDTAGRLPVGRFTEKPEPFMGPVISNDAASAVVAAQERLRQAGGRVLVETQHLRERTGLLSPGLIDVTDVTEREDREIFGPLLQVVQVETFEEAIVEANWTRFGLAAGLISRRRSLYEHFYDEVRAGIVNWNQQLTGASSLAPFGGIGQSGNHRPSGYFAADYCSYAVGSIEREQAALPENLPPGLGGAD